MLTRVFAAVNKIMPCIYFNILWTHVSSFTFAEGRLWYGHRLHRGTFSSTPILVRLELQTFGRMLDVLEIDWIAERIFVEFGDPVQLLLPAPEFIDVGLKRHAPEHAVLVLHVAKPVLQPLARVPVG